MKRWVLLGTGTGVGKTHVGARLVGAWRERGHPAWGLKPIESGVDDDGAITDALHLRGGGVANPEGLHQHALRDPISPHLAALRSGLEISLPETVAWIERSERALDTIHGNAPHAMSLVETAGGAWTPLSPAGTCAHLALALQPATVVLVAPDALGVLHDVGATLRSLHQLGCPVDLLILSGARPPDASTGTNAHELERIVFPALGAAAPRVPRVFQLPAGSDDVGNLLDAGIELAARTD